MTTQVPHATIEHLRAVMPGQAIDWYIRVGQLIEEGLMPMPMAEVVKNESLRPQTRVEVVAKPKAEVSEAAKAPLLELCRGNMTSAERLVAAERRSAYSEENAWQRAYDKLMDERVNLYANIYYNS